MKQATPQLAGTRRRDRRVAVLTTCLLLALLCLPAPPDDTPGRFDHLLPEHADKWTHAVLFAGESFFLHRAFRHGVGPWPRAPMASTWAAASLLAVLSEGLQSRIPGRFADLNDVIADLAGVLLWHLFTLAGGRRRGAP